MNHRTRQSAPPRLEDTLVPILEQINTTMNKVNNNIGGLNDNITTLAMNVVLVNERMNKQSTFVNEAFKSVDYHLGVLIDSHFEVKRKIGEADGKFEETNRKIDKISEALNILLKHNNLPPMV